MLISVARAMRSSLRGWDLAWNNLLRAAACLGVSRLRVMSSALVRLGTCSLAKLGELESMIDEQEETECVRAMS